MKPVSLRDYPRGLVPFNATDVKIAHQWPKDFLSDHFGANTYESTAGSFKDIPLSVWVKSDPEALKETIPQTGGSQGGSDGKSLKATLDKQAKFFPGGISPTFFPGVQGKGG
jgi:hypothetical protein